MAFAKIAERSPTEIKAFQNYLQHPVQAVKDWFGVTPDDWQGNVLTGTFTDKDRSAYKAAHGVGKTTLDAWAGWIFLNGYTNARLVATAPTIHQLTDALWPEYSKWHQKMPEKMKSEWSLSNTHIRHKDTDKNDYSKTWFATARTSNKPANLQGFHNEHLMIQGDEGSAIPEPVFEVIEGTLSEAGDEGKIAKLLLGGNPNFTSGELYNAFTRNSDLYHCVTITGDPEWFESLNINDGDYVHGHGFVFLSKRVSQRYRNTMEKKYGKDSAIYDVRVRGIFPRAADDVILPFEWVERAMNGEFKLPTFDPIADPVTIVVDPSRGGAAETAIGTFRRGYCTGLWGHKTKSTTVIRKIVKDLVLRITASGLRLNMIIVDEPGVGGGVIDELREENLPVKAYNGSSLKTGVDPAEDIRTFASKRARDYWHLRRQLEMNNIPLPFDEVLLAQATTLKYRYRVGDQKITVESKEDLKNRLGPDASPDRADVIVMGTAPWYESAAVHGSLSEDDILFGETGDREFAQHSLPFETL